MGNFQQDVKKSLQNKAGQSTGGTQKINMPFSELMKLHQECESINKTKSLKVLWDPNRPRYLSKIRQFYNDNGVRIQAFMDRHNQIDLEFYEVETIILEGGKTEKKFVMEGEAPNIKAKLKEGKTQEEYDQKMKELFAEIVPVII